MLFFKYRVVELKGYYYPQVRRGIEWYGIEANSCDGKTDTWFGNVFRYSKRCREIDMISALKTIIKYHDERADGWYKGRKVVGWFWNMDQVKEMIKAYDTGE